MALQVQKAKKIADELMKVCHKHADGMDELVKDWNSNSKDLGFEISKVLRDIADCLHAIGDCLDEKPKKRKKK